MRPVTLALLAIGCASQPQKPPVLPLVRAHLYETGVGYFERSGNLRDASALPVPVGHLDDALKSLVILSNSGSLESVEFSSSLSNGMGRALAGLPPTSDGDISQMSLLESFIGAEVVITTENTSANGRLVEVLCTEACEQQASLSLLVLTDNGEVARFAGDELVTVRPTDTVLKGRLNSALDALSPRSAQARRALSVMAHAEGPVTLGYIAETPLWRTTYRLLLDGEGNAALQTWALLHNDTDEDWRNVEVHLVNGQPDSFLLPLAAPRYGRRELATPENELSTVPQLLRTSADELWGDFDDEELFGEGIGSVYGAGGLGSGSGVSGRGGFGSVGRSAGIGYMSDTASPLLEVGNLTPIEEAQGAEVGVLFDYQLPHPISLRAHGSALIPFVAKEVKAREVTWVSAPGTTARAAALFRNATSFTLPAGPISIFADRGFAGESTIDRTKPGEEIFVQFAFDLDVELEQADFRATEKTQRLTYAGTLLQVHVHRKTSARYTITNRSMRKRTVYLPLNIGNNSKVEGADELDFLSDKSGPIAVFEVEPSSKSERHLETEQGIMRQIGPGHLDLATLERLADAQSVPAAERRIVRDAARVQEQVEALREKMSDIETAMATLTHDLERLRGYLKALGNEVSPEGPATTLVNRILSLENQLAAHRKELSERNEERDARITVVSKILEKLPAPK